MFFVILTSELFDLCLIWNAIPIFVHSVSF
ncbi:hypothetical protein Pint_01546 [Pistacia integerrima]|nr:hypothetical protein Pint_01546 [Pistacia integerrima]